MYNFYKSALLRILFSFCSLFFITCVPKPNGMSIIDTALFSNYIFSTASSVLKVKVQGLASGTSFTISNQDSENLVIEGNGEFEFPKKKPKFSNFTVSIVTQPVSTPSQTCVITNPTGTIGAGSTIVEINCGTQFFDLNLNVFGLASPLSSGSLSVNNGLVDTLNITLDGTYTFSAKVSDTSTYSVSIGAQPAGYNCIIETTPPASGTMNGTAVTLNVNCLSLIDSFPINQTAITMGSSIRFTFSKPVKPLSCSFTAPTPSPSNPCSSNLGPFAATLATLNYSGTTVTVNPSTTWPGGLLNQCIQLSGCLEDGTNRPFNVTTPIRYGVTNQIKYVIAGGMTTGTCSSILNACDKIQYAITQCNTATPCFIEVAQGTYSMTGMGDRILLIDKLQLLGGFRNDFQARDSASFPSIIRDDVGTSGCGSSDFTTCTPIAAGTFTQTSDMIIQGFTIITNQFNPWGTGIWLSNINTGGFSFSIKDNLILGSVDTTSAYSLFIAKSAIYASNIGPNFIVSGNYILGGSGNSQSIGMRILEGTQGVIANNYISGGSHLNVNDGLDYSAGMMIGNTTENTTQSLKIVNNIFNSHHITAGPVTAATSAAIQALWINSPNLIFINNTIYGGSGSVRSIGISQRASYDLNVKMFNNQIFTNPAAPTSTCLYYGGNNVDIASDIRGNNFIGCNTQVQTTAITYKLCGTEPDALFDSATCTAALTTASQRNFSHDPNFNIAASPTNVFGLSTSSKCNTVFGGVDPGFASPISQLYQFDLLGNPRTGNSPPADPVPFGSFGYSIGAIEMNKGCSP